MNILNNIFYYCFKKAQITYTVQVNNFHNFSYSRIYTMEEKLKQIKSICKRVVLYGPESTGKTTLAKKLSDHYNVSWVPEFARDFLQKIWDEEKRVCEPKDLLPIAIGQMKA